LGVGLTTLPCKKIVEKPPRNSTMFNGRRLRRKPRPKLGCGAKEEEEEKKKKNIKFSGDETERQYFRSNRREETRQKKFKNQ
jgi:hypothetical protein